MNIGLMDINNVQDENFRVFRQNGTSDYLFVLFKSLAQVMYNGKYINVTNGDAVLFDINMPQEYFPIGNEKFVHDFMHFKVNNEAEETLISDIPKGKPFTLAKARNISGLLSEIKNETFNHFSVYSEQILTHLGNIFLYRLKDEFESITQRFCTNKPYFDTLEDLRTKIYNEPYHEWTINKLSNNTHISRSYLQHLYKDYFSVSIKADIINARISYAKILLFTTKLGISQIAERCGYNNTEHFIRQFKEKTSLSPSKYAKAFETIKTIL